MTWATEWEELTHLIASLRLAMTDPAAARQRVKVGVDRLKTRKDWSLQITALPATFEVLRNELEALSVPLVIDHFGEVRSAEGVGQPGFGTIVNWVKSGKAYVKISHAQALSRQPDLSDIAPFAKALISDAAIRRMILAENPARLYGFWFSEPRWETIP